MSQVQPKYKHRRETQKLIYKGTLRPKLTYMCYANKLILYLYGTVWLLDIHAKECVYTSLQDKH